MDVGTTETESKNINELYLETNKEMYEILKEKIDESHIQYNIIDGGVHHESAWKKRFPDIIKFLFND